MQQFIQKHGTWHEVLSIKNTRKDPTLYQVYYAGGVGDINLISSRVYIGIPSDLIYLKDIKGDFNTLNTIESVFTFFQDSKYGSLEDIVQSLILSKDGGFWMIDYQSTLSTLTKTFRKLLLDEVVEHRRDIKATIELFEPTIDNDSPDKVSIFLTHKDRLRNRATTMKVGRAIRRMFKNLSNMGVANITETWLERSSPREFTLVVSREAEHFAYAYDSHRSICRNPKTLYNRKNISTSCMQHVGREVDVDGFRRRVSVGEAYASGNFEIAYLKDAEGLIAGRVVYGRRRPCEEGSKFVNQPIYGACEQSLDMLQEHLDSVGSEYSDDECDWYGLRLLIIGGLSDAVVPYLDCGQDVFVSESEKHFVIGGDEFSLSETCGHLNGSGAFCACCEGSGFEGDEIYWTPDTDEPYCPDCYFENYVEDELSNEWIPISEAVFDVRQALISRCGSVTIDTLTTHEDNVVHMGSLCDEAWLECDCSYDEESGEYIPTHLFAEKEEEEEEEKEEEVA
mgnify:FL=1